MFIIYLFFNCLSVMIANRMSPGITIGSYEKVVNIGADLLISIVIGMLNTLIIPLCIFFNILPTLKKIIIFVMIVSFGSYIILALTNYGVKVDAFYGVIFAGSIVSLISVITNLLYRQKYIR